MLLKHLSIKEVGGSSGKVGQVDGTLGLATRARRKKITTTSIQQAEFT